MREYAHIFFILLNESYRVEAEERLQELNVAAFPHLQSEQGKQLINSFKMQADDILDVFDEPAETDSSKLKELLNGKP